MSLLSEVWKGQSGFVNFSKRVDGYWVTRWYDLADGVPNPPLGVGDRWFSLNPSREIPKTNAKGKPALPDHVRTRRGIVSSVGVLYAEFDGDHQWHQHLNVLDLEPFPSAVVASSKTGYHCYWFLDEPFIIKTKEDLVKVSNIQRRWVKSLRGADPTVHDISRVLRVPGTINTKYNPPQEVVVRVIGQNKRFPITELAARLPEEPKIYTRFPSSAVVSNNIAARELAEMIPRLPKALADDYDSWVKFGGSLRCLGDVGLELWHTFSALSPKYDPEECDKKWEVLPHDELGVGTAYWYCSTSGVDKPRPKVKGWRDVARK